MTQPCLSKLHSICLTFLYVTCRRTPVDAYACEPFSFASPKATRRPVRFSISRFRCAVLSSRELRPAIVGGMPPSPLESFALRLWEGCRPLLRRASPCDCGRDTAIASGEPRPAFVGGMPPSPPESFALRLWEGCQYVLRAPQVKLRASVFTWKYVLRASDVKLRASVFT